MTPSPPEPGAPFFAWAAWLILLVAAVGLVVAFGPTIPIWDDFDIVPVLCGARPLTIGYLWSQHNEHRLFLTRLLEIAAYHLSGGDFRAGMFASVSLMAVASAVLMRAARTARGHASYADALFPLLLLGPAHHESFLWSSNVTNVAPVALAACLLAALWTGRGWPGPARAAGLGLLLSALPLCNAVGVSFAPMPALWMVAGGVAVARAGGEGSARRAIALGLGGLVPLVLTFLYFRGLGRAAQAGEAAGFLAVVETSAQFLGMALGPASVRVGPGAGWCVAGAVAMAGLVLGVAAVRRRGDRPALLGLLAFLGSVLLLAAGVGWGRSGLGGLAGAQARYAAMAAPALLLVAAAFERAGFSTTRRLAPMAVFTALALLLWPNAESALAAGREARAEAAAFLDDLNRGVPRHLLLRRHVPQVHPAHEDLGRMLDLLRSASIEPFRRMAPDPPMAEVAVPAAPVSTLRGTWDDATRTATFTGYDPFLVFELPAAPYIAGVRLRYDHSNAEGSPAHFKLGWRRADQPGFPRDQEYSQWTLPTGPGNEVTLWLGSPASQLRIQPDSGPCSFTVRELTVLVPR